MANIAARKVDTNSQSGRRRRASRPVKWAKEVDNLRRKGVVSRQQNQSLGDKDWTSLLGTVLWDIYDPDDSWGSFVRGPHPHRSK